MTPGANAASKKASIADGEVSGEPAEAPDAPRLIYDTGGLAINPDPNAAPGSANASGKQFRMRLPVLVLPPKPGT